MLLQKLLDGSKLGRHPSDGSRQCQLAAWHSDDFDEWTLEPGIEDLSPFSLGEPRCSEEGLWDSFESSGGSRAMHAPAHARTSDEATALSTVVHARYEGDRSPLGE